MTKNKGGFIMGMTMTQKILASAAGLEEVHAGDLIMANLDFLYGSQYRDYFPGRQTTV